MTTANFPYTTTPPLQKEGEWWYVAKAETAGNKGGGFTSMPENAATDRNGIPILCPGDMNRVWKAEHKRAQAKRDRIWEMLMDTMEEKIELDEKFPPGKRLSLGQHGMVVTAREHIKGKIDLLHSVLAVLELPAGSYDNDPTIAVESIAKKAKQRYEAES